MSYVIAGYIIVLTILFLYGVQLVWRRRRLTRALARVAASTAGPAVATPGPDGPIGDHR